MLIIKFRIFFRFVAVLLACLLVSSPTVAAVHIIDNQDEFHIDVKRSDMLLYQDVKDEDYVSCLDVVAQLYKLGVRRKSNETTSKVSNAASAKTWLLKTVRVPKSDLADFDLMAPCTKENAAWLLYHFTYYYDIYVPKIEMDFIQGLGDVDDISKNRQTAVAWAVANELLFVEHADYDRSHMPQCGNETPCLFHPRQQLDLGQLSDLMLRYALYLSTNPTRGEKVVEFSRQYIGTDYIWGGATPSGFDCSGFIYYVFSSLNYDIGIRTNANGYSDRVGRGITQQYRGTNQLVDVSRIPVGSVISFDWEWDGRADHIGIWTGETMIHAKGSQTNQYAVNGWMVCENKLTTNDIVHICSVKSFDSLLKR